jgi:hypothetical protein
MKNYFLSEMGIFSIGSGNQIFPLVPRGPMPGQRENDSDRPTKLKMIPILLPYVSAQKSARSSLINTPNIGLVLYLSNQGKRTLWPMITYSFMLPVNQSINL